MRRLLGIAGLLAACVAVSASPASPASGAPALTQVAAPTNTGQPGPWTTDRFAQFYSKSITGELFSSAAVGDIGSGGTAIVAGFPDGNVYAWNAITGARVLKFFTGPGAVHASPVLVDLDGDGVLDILAANTAGDVVGFNVSGRTLFRAHDDCSKFCGIFGTPTVADLDRDGRREVIVGSWDQHVYAWHIDDRSQARGFPTFVGDTIWSSPAVADLDGDGYPEVIIGGDCDGVPGQRCYPQRGGYVWVFRHDGSEMPGWPRFVPNQVVWSSPAIADLNGDGALDVVVGTGTMMPAPAGSVVYAFDRNGRDLPGWPAATGGRVMGSPAIGDISGDGRPDVVVPAEDGRIYAFDRGGRSLAGWPQCNANARDRCPVTAHGSVALADIDGDGRVDVVNGGEQWMRVFGADGGLEAQAGTKSGTLPLVASPTIAAVGGRTWIVQSSGFDVTGDGGADIGGVWAWTTSTGLGAAPWPMFKHDVARSGSAVGLPTGPVSSRPAAGPSPATPSTVPRRTRTSATAAPTSTVPPPTTTEAPTTTTSEESTTTTVGGELHLAGPAHHGGDGPSPWLYAGGALLVAAGAAGVIIRWRLIRPVDLSTRT